MENPTQRSKGAKNFPVLAAEFEALATEIVDVAYFFHRELGPGLLEAIYESCFCAELADRGISFERQTLLPLFFKGRRVQGELRLDILVEHQITLEMKAVEVVLPVHTAQVQSDLRLTGHPLGFLLNFNVPLMKEGIYRIINPHRNSLRSFAP